MLTEEDRAIYEWQLDVAGFGEEGQEKLRSTTALVSRIGGLGGPIAFALAAAGIGKLILAHAGNLRKDDLNRQILMQWEGLGKPRVESAAKTLAAFNPKVEVEIHNENFSETNAAALVSRADIVFSSAPLFEERLLMNRECVRQNKTMVDCAMYSLEGHVMPIVPGETPCLACLFPETPPHWKRRFPVFGAVSALVANFGVMEGLKLIADFGSTSRGKMMLIDANRFNIRKIDMTRRIDCLVCS
jgi:molybdopterin/thiamine biosynthesis adenylyltransferase